MESLLEIETPGVIQGNYMGIWLIMHLAKILPHRRIESH